jgi:hypothetical protein
MQDKMGRSGHNATGQHPLELGASFQAVHDRRQVQWFPARAPAATLNRSDRQALAPFGTPGIDDSTPAPGFHTHQEAVGAGATNF